MASSNNSTPTPTASFSQSAASTSTRAQQQPTPPQPPQWTLQQIHANAANWSLEGDAQLLEMMRSISGNLEQRCRATQRNCDQMLLGLDSANLRLENTCNKMLTLKNLQFIEARVRDDVEESSNTAAVATSRADVPGVGVEPPLTTQEAVEKAVDKGVQMLNKYFERVELRLDDDSDSDADEASKPCSIMFRTRNPHDDRPLPYLIGSKEWRDKWHVGLLESDDDDDDEEDDDDIEADQRSAKKTTAAEEFSSSSSDEDDDTLSRSVSLPSNVRTTPSDQSDSRRSSARPSVDAAGAAGDSGIYDDMLRPVMQFIGSAVPYQAAAHPPAVKVNRLFDDSDSDAADGTAATAVEQPAIVNPARAEQQRVKVLPTLPAARDEPKSTAAARPADAPASIFRQPVQPARQQQQQRAAAYDLFADEPPELDAPAVTAAAPPSKPKPANLFFDDSEDEDELPAPPVVKAQPVVKPQPVLQTPMATKTATIPPQAQPVVKQQPVLQTPIATRTATIPPPPLKTRSVFDSTDDESEQDQPKYVPKPKPVVSAASAANPPATKSNISRLFDDAPPDDLFDVLIARKPTTAAAARGPSKTKSIFDDEDDELFGRGASFTIPKREGASNDANANETRKVLPSVSKKTRGIFDSDEEELPTNHAANEFDNNNPGQRADKAETSDVRKPETISTVQIPTIPRKSTKIFDSDDDELFGNKTTAAVIKSSEPSNSRGSESAARKTVAIFDSDEDELFGTRAKSASARPEPKKSYVLFDDNANTEDKVSASSIQKTPALVKEVKPIVSTSINRPTTSNIFDDMLNNEPPDDDFASIFAKPKPTLSVPTNRKSLFDTGDDSDEWERPKKSVEKATTSITTTTKSTLESSISVLSDNSNEQGTATPTTSTARTVDKSMSNDNEEIPPNLRTHEQYANLHTADESTETANASLIRGRPSLPSFLDIEQPPEDNTSVITVADKSVEVPEIVGQSEVPIRSSESENTSAIDFDSDVVDKAVETLNPEQNDSSEFQIAIDDKSDTPKRNYESENTATNQIEVDVVEPAVVTPNPIQNVSSTHRTNSDKSTPPELPPLDISPNVASVSSPYAYLFDDVPPEDDFDEVVVTSKPAEKKSSQLDASFFDNLPPDDDHFESQPPVNATPKQVSSTAMFDDLPPDDNSPNTQSSKSTSENAMALFDDLPPDDDKHNLFARKSSVTTMKKVFYEDFADTVIAAPNNDELTSSPSPIIGADKPNVASNSITNIKDKLSLITNQTNSPPATKDISSTKPKKLNSNLQINVAALLPGARRSSTANPTTSVRTSEEITGDEEPIPTSIPTNTRAAENSTGLLVGLTKGRAKPNIRRQPSTRQGRLNELRKSKMDDDSVGSQDVGEIPPAADAKPSKSIADMLNSDNETDDDWLVSSKPAAVAQPKTVVQQQSGSSLVKKQPVKSTVGLFSDDDDDDLFGASSKPLPPKITPTIKPTSQPQVPYAKESATTAIRSNKLSASLFADVDDEDAEDDLFGTKARNQSTKSAAIAHRSLFGDSDADDDEDDLFGTSSKKKMNKRDSAKQPPKLGRSNTTTVPPPTSSTASPADPLADLWK